MIKVIIGVILKGFLVYKYIILSNKKGELLWNILRFLHSYLFCFLEYYVYFTWDKIEMDCKQCKCINCGQLFCEQWLTCHKHCEFKEICESWTEADRR